MSVTLKRNIATGRTLANRGGERRGFREQVAPLHQNHAVLVRSLRRQRCQRRADHPTARSFGRFLRTARGDACVDVNRLAVLGADLVPPQSQMERGQRVNENKN